MSSEHPIKQPIIGVSIADGGGIGDFNVGRNCSRIEATTKSGLHADLPYIRVWLDDTALMEICQHNCHAVYFGKLDQAAE